MNLKEFPLCVQDWAETGVCSSILLINPFYIEPPKSTPVLVFVLSKL